MNNVESGSPSWTSSFFIRTTGDVSRTVTDAAATNAHSTRPSVMFSPRDERCHSPLQKLQRQVTKALKGFSSPSEVKSSNYNPEILTTQKRQWARFHLESLNHKPLKEASRIFESLAVVGLHPHCDVQVLREQFIRRKFEGSGKIRSALGHLQSRIEPNTEPQVLFVYPPEKQLPLKCKDLVSFCFPAGAEVHAIERTPSMSEISEILIGQDHLKQSSQSFVFRLQVADSSTLYGCCLLADELVQKPSRLVSVVTDKKPFVHSLNRHILTTRRCYCILSRLPYFELHFGVLNSIFIEERLERLTTSIEKLGLKPSNLHNTDELLNDELGCCYVEHQMLDSLWNKEPNDTVSSPSDPKSMAAFDRVDEAAMPALQSVKTDVYAIHIDKQMDVDSSCPVLPHLHSYQYESSESSTSFYGSPDDDWNFRSDFDETETEEASSAGLDDFTCYSDILEWAKANNCGSLRIICEYYRLPCPPRGSTLTFRPLGYLHPLEFHRPSGTIIHMAGSMIDINSCRTNLELAEAHSALLAEEEATALSVWSLSCICGSLRLENVLTLFAGVLLEKQVIVVCSNLGILSALVLSIIPLIRPYQWQSLLMPVLPNDMLDFLDAPVPYVVGVKNKTPGVQLKSGNVILVDANKSQVKSPTLPHLPKHMELLSSLTPLHAKLVGESYLGSKRPVYKYTDVQFEAAKGFLGVLRDYLDSLCSNMRSHTITNVQSNDDKVSLLLKESFIESFPARDRPFMKLFVDTQLFSVHTDLALSAFQKE